MTDDTVDSGADPSNRMRTDGGSPSDTASPTIERAAECSFVDATLGRHGAGVLTVIIDRPDARNALNGQVRSELKGVFGEIPADDAVRVVVLTGSDEAKAFVAGADVTELRDRDVVEQREASQRPRVYETVADCPKPVIARLNGHALGGGCELAQACDIRIAHERAKLGQPEINLGIIPGGGGTQRLVQLVGPGHAMRLALSGELIDAEEAADIGLVEEVLTDDDFDNRVHDLASTIAGHSPIAVERAKEAVKVAQNSHLEQGIDHEKELFVGLFGTHDKNEGIDAFLEDREPEWTGR